VKKLKLSSDSGGCGSQKCKRGYGGTCDGVWQSLESGCWYWFGAFGRNLPLVNHICMSINHLTATEKKYLSSVLAIFT
jgi:hypothetical protein